MILLTVNEGTEELGNNDYIRFEIDGVSFCISRRKKNIIDITDIKGKEVHFTLAKDKL